MDKVEKLRDAMNVLAKKWCGVSDAYSIERAAETLRAAMDNGQDADTVVERVCAVAYGLEDDIRSALDHQLRLEVQRACQALHQGGVEPALVALVDVMVNHWDDLTEDEKLVVDEAVIDLLKKGVTNEWAKMN